ncbi:hypothetical protein GJ744_008189 [Endocarpon pusillum]|uniref:Uncharacterized protein n=1 Tax=Endocarpon pusillum TaxID=364733 RepID=A0A8H7AHN1_9EURO|nr:hypothetical protein GJ744_008189 [Endocarpon pusillum]
MSNWLQSFTGSTGQDSNSSFESQVGLIGNLQEGYSVAISLLQETNTNVKQILRRDLALAVRVKNKQPLKTGTYLKLPSLKRSILILTNDGIIPLDQADIRALGLEVMPKIVAEHKKVADSDSTTIVDNITVRQERIMIDDIRVKSWQKQVRGESDNC